MRRSRNSADLRPAAPGRRQFQGQADVVLDVEEEDFALLLEELSLFLASLFDSDLDSVDFSPAPLLDSPFWPLRA
jgi:hypothetical protein